MRVFVLIRVDDLDPDEITCLGAFLTRGAAMQAAPVVPESGDWFTGAQPSSWTYGEYSIFETDLHDDSWIERQ